MARPDLTTPEGRRAYSRELARVAMPWRFGGLGLVLLAAAMLFWVRWIELPVLGSWMGQAGMGLMAIGWVLIIVAIAKRTAWHRARMAEKP